MTGPAGAGGSSFAAVLWAGWKAYTAIAARYQATLWLSLLYFLVLGPSGMIARLLGRRMLLLDTATRPSYWLPSPASQTTIDALKRQF